MKFEFKLTLILLLLSCVLYAAEPGEPPVKPDYPTKLDRAATLKWWENAKLAREGKFKYGRFKAGTKTITGRHFIDLEVPRDETVAFALYTLHNKTLKMTAQLFPLFPDESREVRLEIEKNGKWQEVSKLKVNDLGWSALFRLENWDDSKNWNYRVRHGDKAMFKGIIRKNPIDQDTIVVASLSCNSSRDPMGRPAFIKNLKTIDPDVLFFAGDQHYEHTEHTAGWLLWGMQFRDVIGDRPTITIPDDHDVGQNNLWGENGIKAKSANGNLGGYFYHPQYVKQVERCQTAHLPDPYDPKPIGQGIGVYFTNLNLGGVDFAILEDRKFKSGPNGKIPKMGPRPDHIRDPKYDPSKIDLPDLILLGDRQHKFLDDWSDNWQGVKMKVALSQTPFGGLAHMHGGPNGRLHADLDSNGWPQTGRYNALSRIRKGFACHLSGDQHLATMVQHGLDEYNDGPWSLVSPAIVNTIYGRYWHPLGEKAGANRDPKSKLPYTGEYLDGFNNKITMHAYANPAGKGKSAGFSVARFNKKDRTIKMECWPRFSDASKGDSEQFAGWPKTIKQTDNFNPPSWGKLGKLTFNKAEPVVQLINAATNDVVYTIRISGNTFTPHAPKTGKFVIKAGVDSADKVVVKSATVADAKDLDIKL